MNKILIIIFTIIQFILMCLDSFSPNVIDPILLFYAVLPLMLLFGIVKKDVVSIAFPVTVNVFISFLQSIYYTKYYSGNYIGQGLKTLIYHLTTDDFIVFQNFQIIRLEPLVFTAVAIIIGVILRKTICEKRFINEDLEKC